MEQFRNSTIPGSFGLRNVNEPFWNSSTMNKPNTTDALICAYTSNRSFASFSFFIIFFIFVSCKLLHVVFQVMGQPRLITEITVGLLIGNLDLMNEILNAVLPSLLSSISEFGMSCYLLVLGLEMDLSVLLCLPSREILTAYASVLFTFIVTSTFTSYINLGNKESIGFTISLAITLSGTASPVLTRLITDLKISKSDIGRQVVTAGMHSDMITMLFISLGLIFQDQHKDSSSPLTMSDVIVTLIIFCIQTWILIKIVPAFVNWINNSNPEGKPMKGSHLVLFIAFMVLLCNFGSTIVGYSPIITAFFIGLAFPRKGRLSKMLNTKINQFLGYVLFPLYFCWIGTLAKFKELNQSDKYIGFKLFFLFLIMTIGKVSGTLLASIILRFHWHEAIAIGLLLNIKGHFHIFAASYAKEEGYIGTGTFIVLIFLTIFTIIYLPSVIAFVIKRAKERIPHRQMGLQWLDQSSELHMLLCIHGPQNVPSMINIIELSRGRGGGGGGGTMNSTSAGLGVYITDMIEINDCMFLSNSEDNNSEGSNSSGIMSDESVLNMREEITNAILRYVEDSGKGINVHRLLTVSTFANMHNDLCNLAEAVLASIIILPYHKNPNKDTKKIIDGGVNHGFRYVNRKVLRHAPCSVGILVDRGFGLINNKQQQQQQQQQQGSSSSTSSSTNTTSSVVAHAQKVAVVFIGGKDDREALSYAVRIAKNSEIHLTAIRFLQDNNNTGSNIDHQKSGGGSSKSLSGARKLNNVMQEQEMKVDDEFFADFYEKNVAHGKVGYIEKHVMNAKETVVALKSLEGQYMLFIVGRGSRVNSISTAMMSDWEEYPDLGPIGEILADKDFSGTTSVLVIQQHYIDDDLDEDFTIM